LLAAYRCAALPLLLATCAAGGCGERGRVPAVRGVVVISLDALGAKHVGAYGYERDTTPALDDFAAQGVLFERAYTQQVWTLTSHVTMMSGLYPKTHGASKRGPARPGATMLAEVLHDAGFATAAFTGAGGYMKPGFGLGRGFDVYGTNRATERGGRAVARWLRERARIRALDPAHRFFLFLHFYDVHSDEGTDLPYDAPPAFRARFLPDGLDWKRRGDTYMLMGMQVRGDVDDHDREVLRSLYDAGVLQADQRRLAPVLRLLDELGLARDTLVVVTSDHGEELFEHGRTTHQQPYEETARVPLVARGPGLPAGARVPALVELVDLMPTVLDLLGLPIPAHVQGESLLPLVAGETPRTPDAHVDGVMDGLAGEYPSGLVRDIDGVAWSLIANVGSRGEGPARRYRITGAPELYRLDRDAGQQHDLARSEPARTAELSRAVLAWFARNEVAGRALGEAGDHPDLLTEAERAQLRALGYSE